MKRMYCIKNLVSTDFHELLKTVHEKDMTGVLEVYSTVTDDYISHQTVTVQENKDPRIEYLCGKYNAPKGCVSTKRVERSYCTVEIDHNCARLKRYHLNKLISECLIAIQANIVLEFTHYGHGNVDKKKPYMTMSTEQIGNTITVQTYRYGSWPVNSFNKVTFDTIEQNAVLEQSRSLGKDSRSVLTEIKKYDTFAEQLVDYPKFDFVKFSTGTALSMVGFGHFNKG